jgi:hypothetical protein
MSSRSIERATVTFTVAMSRFQNRREWINEITGPSQGSVIVDGLCPVIGLP